LARVVHFLGDRVEAGLRRANFWLLAAFSVGYFAATWLLACRKPIWYDEFFTLHLSRLPHLADLWAALAEGTDLNPPVGYLAVRLAQAVLGDGAWVARLPSAVGFWILCLCLFRFVARRAPLLYAWIALLLPLTTVAYSFAYEARAYGLVLGFCGLSLVCWQAVAEGGGRRRQALAGLALSLAAALWTHYYAVLLLVPLALGEGVRTWIRRRVDRPVWAAFAVAALSLGLLWPLVAQARTFAGTFWARPEWAAVKPAYLALLPPLKTPLLVALVALVFYPERGPIPGRGGPSHEMAAALGLAALPVLGMLLGEYVTGVFTFRYILPAVAGLSLVVAFVSCRRSAGCVFLGGALLLCLLQIAVQQGNREYARLTNESARIAAACDYLGANSSAGLPVVVSGPLPFLELAHHASPELAARLYYLSDPALSQHYLHHDTAERALRNLRRRVPVGVVDYGDFLAGHHRFLVYGDDGWLRPALQAAGARFEARGRCEGRGLYLVDTVGDAGSPKGDERVTSHGD
jgi:hypothetical protein